LPVSTRSNALDSFTTFGDMLRYLRRRAGLTQTELAIAVGYSHAQISRLEQNHRWPDLATVAARFVPALDLADEPVLKARLLQLAGSSVPPAATGRSLPPHNLPLQLTSFIGREQEIAAVRSLLPSARLVTLTGAGGSGKTRLALQVASDVPAAYDDGVWLVDLAPLSNADLVPHKVAAALGVAEQPGRTLLATLTDFLRSRQVLLILDNCEHQVEACALLVEALLGACPGLTMLATSREALGIAGEMLYALPPLACPDPHQLSSGRAIGSTIDRLSQYDAVRLFVERARAVAPTFHLTAENSIAVAQVCQQLDGIPLAIELAAARVRLLSLDQIADRLADRFNLLTNGRRTALPRHQTLRGLIDWSHDLLTEQERAMLRRLAVFAGGFSLQAATAVSAGDGIEASDVLDLLSHLVDKSLVLVEPGPSTGEPRYRLLETIRQYALERLHAAREAMGVQSRHAQYFLSLAERAEPWLMTGDRGFWTDHLEAELDNLRAALEWSETEAGSAEVMVRLAGALFWFWNRGSYLSEALTWLTRALARDGVPSETSARAKVLYGAGFLTRRGGHLVSAADLLAESVRLWRAAGTVGRTGLAHALVVQGSITRDQGDPTAARSLVEEAIALFRDQGDRWGLAYGLTYLGLAIRDQEDLSLARATIGESVALWRDLKDLWGLGLALFGLGEVELRQGDYETARSRVEEALAVSKAAGDKVQMARSLHDLGLIMLNLGDEAGARPFFEESLILQREVGDQFGIALNLKDHGVLALYDGDEALAQSYFKQALELAREVGPNWLKGDCLKGPAGLAAVRGQARRAARLWGAAEAQLAAAASYMDNSDCIFFGRILSHSQTQLGAAAFEVARAEGRAMTLEQAIEYAFAEPGR